jgi:hypothetical protein
MSTLAVECDLKPVPDIDCPIIAETTLGDVAEMLLKDRRRLDTLLREPERQRELIPRLLAVALIGFVAYGLVTTFLLNALDTSRAFWLPGVPAAHWRAATAGNLTLGYALGLIAANCVCLPSFYFYSLLAGVRTPMLAVAAHALKGMAGGAIALVGVLPLYVALALAAVVFPLNRILLGEIVLLGLALPFVAGIWGAVCLYQGFIGLADTMPSEQRRSRTCFLRRLILAWCGCYTLVTPLMIYTLWDALSHAMG